MLNGRLLRNKKTACRRTVVQSRVSLEGVVQKQGHSPQLARYGHLTFRRHPVQRLVIGIGEVAQILPIALSLGTGLAWEFAWILTVSALAGNLAVLVVNLDLCGATGVLGQFDSTINCCSLGLGSCTRATRALFLDVPIITAGNDVIDRSFCIDLLFLSHFAVKVDQRRDNTGRRRSSCNYPRTLTCFLPVRATQTPFCMTKPSIQ